MVAFVPPFFFLGKSRLKERDPTTNGGMQNGSSVGTCTHCIHAFAYFAPICMLSRSLLTKISASELSAKFICCELLVGEGSLLEFPLLCSQEEEKEEDRFTNLCIVSSPFFFSDECIRISAVFGCMFPFVLVIA